MDDLLEQGIAAYKSGKREEARRLLITYVKQHPDEEAGWGWLFNGCDTYSERMYCLKQVIRVNPQNEKAIQLIEKYTAPTQPAPKPAVQSVKQLPQQPLIAKTPGRDLKNDALVRKITRFLRKGSGLKWKSTKDN